ncbi:MAG: FkbM family methyltransferase [Verrucomicrobiota bacterium]|nr:FkbM family methyltransferase [Verrucomicrobiota bacterium]
MSSLFYEIKRRLRVWDSRLASKTRDVSFDGHSFRFYTPFWWSDVSQSLLETEITPYFSALGDAANPSVIIDVGAATGHFAVLAAKIFSDSTVYAFEPSERQRILLERNAKLNQLENIEIQPQGLWNRPGQLAFRTNGAESSFESVSRFRGKLPFLERVEVLPLDQWSYDRNISRVDLIKMDAEGAELEILEGARELLQRDHPRLLIQAYHIRDGVRTFERCADILKGFNYTVGEAVKDSGLLCAR